MQELRVELEAVNARYSEMHDNLEKAEEYIISLQEDIRLSQGGTVNAEVQEEMNRLRETNELLST